MRTVVAVAVVREGRVLAARRAGRSGGWELPGGKVEPGEDAATASVREITEELGCVVEPDGEFGEPVPIDADHVLVGHLARLVAGEPVPREHDAVRWLGAADLDAVIWLPPDRPLVDRLRRLL